MMIIGYIENDELRFAFYNSGWNTYSTSSSSLPTDKWIYVVVTYDGTTADIYVDGFKQTGSWTQGNVQNLVSNSVPLYIGTQNSGSHLFKGAIDEVMIFDRALTDNEVQVLYNLDLN